jgi:hypothetical protein
MLTPDDTLSSTKA